MITGLHHYALEVPDLDVASTFLAGFGLEAHDKDGVLVAQCPGRHQVQAVMLEAPRKRLHHVAFSVDAVGLDTLRDRLDRHGVSTAEPPSGGADDGIWLRDPHGVPVQLVVEHAPARDIPVLQWNTGAEHTRHDTPAWRSLTQDVMPRRLGHTLLFTPDQKASTAFYVDALGLAVSDTIHGKVTFLNAGPGDHHVFGFITSTHSGFHHASYEVPSVDAIGIGVGRMQDAGFTTGWGLGRHTIGSNWFHYTQDPWGSWIEWFSDIDQIRDCWVANDWDVPPHLWGPPPPPSFLTNAEPRD